MCYYQSLWSGLTRYADLKRGEEGEEAQKVQKCLNTGKVCTAFSIISLMIVLFNLAHKFIFFPLKKFYVLSAIIFFASF